MKILGISGSLRAGSYNTTLLRAAADLLPPGVELEIYPDLKLVPPFDEDDEPHAHDAVHDLRAAIKDADALLIATPEYNGSLPGQLKNAIDWASRPKGDAALANKPVTVVGASQGMFGAVWAQADLRKVLSTAGARVIGDELPIAHAHEAFDDDGKLRSEELTDALAGLVEQLVEETSRSVELASTR
jgi:chromate reductase, NAD(P)H dehydrogenase (quinone)